jgi:hypothetical protein
VGNTRASLIVIQHLDDLPTDQPLTRDGYDTVGRPLAIVPEQIMRRMPIWQGCGIRPAIPFKDKVNSTGDHAIDLGVYPDCGRI